ncbi:MAG: hypothetical protein ACREPM_08110 [Gemmatimonadaceae bacterium]
MPRFQLHHMVLGVAAAGALACGASGSGGSSVVPSGSETPRTRSDRAVISTEELRSSRETSLYDAIQRMRPEWLRTRGATSIQTGMSGNTAPDAINVFQDLQKLGSVDVLRSIAITQASSLRFYTASEAQMRFGTGNPNGAIQIITAP